MSLRRFGQSIGDYRKIYEKQMVNKMKHVEKNEVTHGLSVKHDVTNVLVFFPKASSMLEFSFSLPTARGAS